MNCRVCNTVLDRKYSKCPYCEYNNKVILTVSSDDSGDYKQDVINNLKNFSVNIGVFKYNESKTTMQKIGFVSLFDERFDGIDCFGNVNVSDKWIAHYEGEHSFEVEYLFRGIKKSVTVTVAFDSKRLSKELGEGWAGFMLQNEWHLAMQISKDLRLDVGLYLSDKTRGNSIFWRCAVVDLDLTKESL